MRWLFLALLAWRAGAADLTKVEGSVFNSVTGEPVRRASVVLASQNHSGPNRTVEADAGGHFLFSDVTAGSYRVWATRRGFAEGMRFAVAVEAGADSVTIRLPPLSIITGRVTDEYGEPLQGAMVQLIQSSVANGRRITQMRQSATADDLGMYRALVEAGRYYVAAQAYGLTPVDATGTRLLYPRVFYPGAPDVRAAIPLNIAYGSEARADLRLEPVRAVHIRGHVEGVGDTPASCILTPMENGLSAATPRRQARVLPDGSFDFGDVVPGLYLLTASTVQMRDLLVRANAPAPVPATRLVGTQEVSVSGTDVQDVVISMTEAPDLLGRVTVENVPGRELEKARVGVVLQPRDPGTGNFLSAQFRPDYTFTISSAIGGDYLLSVPLMEPYYLKSAVFGNVDVLTNGLTVPRGGVLPPLEIMIGSKAAQISGDVMDQDKPAAGASVLIKRQGSQTPGLDKIVRADERGHFVVRGLSPGDYTALAAGDWAEVEYANPQVLQQYNGTSVTVAEGAKETVTLKLNREQGR